MSEAISLGPTPWWGAGVGNGPSCCASCVVLFSSFSGGWGAGSPSAPKMRSGERSRSEKAPPKGNLFRTPETRDKPLLSFAGGEGNWKGLTAPSLLTPRVPFIRTMKGYFALCPARSWAKGPGEASEVEKCGTGRGGAEARNNEGASSLSSGGRNTPHRTKAIREERFGSYSILSTIPKDEVFRFESILRCNRFDPPPR